MCCGKEMEEIKPNEVDASFEKHVPQYDKNDESIIVNVNHVMEENHYIKWIMMVSENDVDLKEFKPGDKPLAVFDYKGPCTLYSYCNLHSLWSKEVK